MPRLIPTTLAFAFLLSIGLPVAARAQTGSYPAMAPLDQYLIADKADEIALARSAAPASISDHAEIMVLEKNGYTTAVQEYLNCIEEAFSR